MEHQSWRAVAQRGNEYGGARAAASLQGVGEAEAAVTPPRLPYPVSLALESGNEDSLREAVRHLIEGAV